MPRFLVYFTFLIAVLFLPVACSPTTDAALTPEAHAFDPGVDFGGGVEVETLSGDYTVVRQDPLFMKLDPGGSSRNLTLPTTHTGSVRWFYNAADAAENLVVKNAAGSTIVTINQNEAALVASDYDDPGTWVLVAVWTIALS